MPKDLLPKVSVKKSDTEYRNNKVILSLGYLQERKGIDCLIGAFKNLGVENTALIIAGSGPDEMRLKKLAGDDKNIYFVGHVEGRRKAIYYSVADMFVLPTLNDPWGLVINEAIYYGLPIVTTTDAGASELVEKEECGLVIKSGDPELLRDAINKILNDKKLEKRFKKNSKVCFKNYSLEEGTKPFLEAFEFALNSNRGRF